MRLAELLSDLLATRGGTWEELWRVHDAALAELVLQAHLVSIAMLSMAIESTHYGSPSSCCRWECPVPSEVNLEYYGHTTYYGHTYCDHACYGHTYCGHTYYGHTYCGHTY